MDLNKLTLGDKIVGGAGILLLLFMLVLDWHRACASTGIPGGGEFCVGIGPMSGDGEAIGILGILAFVVALAVVIATLVRKLTSTDLPDLPVSWGEAIFYGSVAVLALLVLKLLFKFDYIGFGAYLMILAAAGMAYGGFLVRGETADGTATGDTPSAPF